MSDEPSDGSREDDETVVGDVDGDPTDDEVVQTAAEAAEGVVFAHYDQSAVTDLDVTVTFEDGVLDVDVYLNAPDDPDPDAVAREAAETAGEAVDELFEA